MEFGKVLTLLFEKEVLKRKFTIYFDYNKESHEIDTFESDEYSLIINSTQAEFEGYIIALKI